MHYYDDIYMSAVTTIATDRFTSEKKKMRYLMNFIGAILCESKK